MKTFSFASRAQGYWCFRAQGSGSGALGGLGFRAFEGFVQYVLAGFGVFRG